ncbi:MAG: hypothetical protein H6Q04_3462 [Acidobacteria bacterium]|nr:hypothetical protein [Acidobacteriota bacterium]
MDEGEVLQVMISFRKATNTDSNEEQGAGCLPNRRDTWT